MSPDLSLFACLLTVIRDIRTNMNGRFEWDLQKAESNWRTHGVTFDHAIKARYDPFGIEWIDDREDYDEERVNVLGMCDGIILHVTYTERGEVVRIITARRAERHEQDHCYRENAS